MRKLILKNGYSPGDIVMLSAAIRDLHCCYPGQFLTDVRTSCPELWEHNPYLTPLDEDEPDVEVIECSYPLIDECNSAPYHCVHGFIEFLNGHLGLRIRPTAFKGDIHLSRREKTWYSQVHELAREEIPFWILTAGGKYDLPIKWWDCRRYQEVIDHFRGKIQFVQVGAPGHYHPRLEGVIDLRGRTNLRELVRLVYHSQGVLCGVTALMHLAAAVEVKGCPSRNRPCVVVAGGREPVHWEAYPDHQFIATNGALSCCSSGGCWKARAVPLGDGDERDGLESRCVDVVDGLPRCMDMIGADEVIRRIELYFRGGVLKHLSRREDRAARCAVRATAKNDYDAAPLTLQNAGIACDEFVRRIPPYPGGFRGRGIVICAGGVRYFTGAWVCIKMLRRWGCSLPIQVWHLGRREMDPAMRSLLAPLGVECIDALALAKRFPVRRLGGWELKPYAILHSRLREVLFLDADNVPVRNPEYLFETSQYRRTGAVFWPDYGQFDRTKVAWESCGLAQPGGPEFESGQLVINKQRCWRALRLCLWFNEYSDFYYQFLHGDKETFHLAFHKLQKPYGFVPAPIHRLEGTMCQHDFAGRRVFQHRNNDKWDLHLRNKRVKGFWFEGECRQFVRELAGAWDGRTSVFRPSQGKPKLQHTSLSIKACMISCRERERLRRQTLRNLAATDWGEDGVFVQIDPEKSEQPQERQCNTARLALERGIEFGTDFLLFLEDDLDFNRHLRHNLECWAPLRNGEVTLAGLYSPWLRELACNPKDHFSLIDSESVYGSQAFLLSCAAAQYIIRHWDEVDGLQDIKMSRLAARLHRPLFYHTPSLVQHVGTRSVWGGHYHQARDFDPSWRA